MTDGVVDGPAREFDDLDEGESLRELLGDRPLDQPIELLVQLAEEGEIDPWDLDLIAVTDAFLERIDDADLVVTARTLFYASVLLRMKSDAVVGGREEPPPEEPPAPFDEPVGDPVAILEREMDRRLTRKRARGTPATLAELIRELRAAERNRFWKPSRTYDTDGDSQYGPQTLDYHAIDHIGKPGDAVGAVSDTPHLENLDAALEPVLSHLEEHFETASTASLAALAHLGPTPARVYQALVFLEHRGAVRLEQETFYADLSVHPGPAGLQAGHDPRDGALEAAAERDA